jgi:type II secretory pathway component PulF
MKVTNRDLQNAVKTLGLLVRRNYPLSEGLATLEKSNPAWLEVSDHLQQGDTAGQALRRYPHLFSEFFCGMVESAEKAPNGEVILESLSTWLEVAEEVRRKVRELLHYPFLLISFLLLELAILVGYGLPGVILPTMFVDTTVGPESYEGICAIASYVFFFLAAACLFGSGKTQWLMPIAIRFPGFRATIIQADLALWARAVGAFLQGGHTLTESLESCSDLVWSSELEAELRTLPKRLAEGDTFSQAMSGLNLIDPQLRWAVTAGEEKEDLSATLLFASERLEHGLLNQCRAFFLLLQPVAVATVGVMTALVLAPFWWSMYHYSWNMSL